MTDDTPPDPLAALLYALDPLATSMDDLAARLRAAGVTLDARPSGDTTGLCALTCGHEGKHDMGRPSGDEALRAAALNTLDFWDTEREVLPLHMTALREAVDALAAPVSQPDLCAICGDPLQGEVVHVVCVDVERPSGDEALRAAVTAYRDLRTESRWLAVEAALAAPVSQEIIERTDLSVDDDPAHDLDGPDPFAPVSPSPDETCYCIEGGHSGHVRLSGTCWYRTPPAPVSPSPDALDLWEPYEGHPEIGRCRVCGDDGVPRTDVEAFLAAPVSPSPDVLDVERLARAMRSVATTDVDCRLELSEHDQEWAAAIAREYAAAPVSPSPDTFGQQRPHEDTP